MTRPWGFGMVLGGAILIAAAPWLVPSSETLRLLTVAAIYALAVVGLNAVVGVRRQLTLAQAALFGLGAYVSALLVTRLELSFAAGLLGAILVCGLVGLLLASSVVRLPGRFLPIVSLGLAEVIRLVLTTAEEVTSGPAGIADIPGPAVGGGLGQTEYWYLAVGCLAAGIMIAHQHRKSSAGDAVETVLNDGVAESESARRTVLAFTLGAMFAGAAGGLWAHQAGEIRPDDFGLNLMVLLLFMLALGGIGSLTGSVAGAVLVVAFAQRGEGLGAYWMVVYGVALLLLMIFSPGGLAGLYQRILYPRLSGFLVRRGMVAPAAPSTGGVLKE